MLFQININSQKQCFLVIFSLFLVFFSSDVGKILEISQLHLIWSYFSSNLKIWIWWDLKNFCWLSILVNLTDTSEFAPKWTRVFLTRRWVILGRFRLWTSFESSLVSVKQPFFIFFILKWIWKYRGDLWVAYRWQNVQYHIFVVILIVLFHYCVILYCQQSKQPRMSESRKYFHEF